MSTRDERINRHYQNSVREKLRELMTIMNPGEQMLWGSYNHKKLLEAAKEKIEEELAYENEPEEDKVGKAQGALALPSPTSSS